MTKSRWRTPAHAAGRAAGLALIAMAMILPASAAANTNEPIAQTGGMTVTIPMLGTSLTVAVTLDGVGNISGVALDPANALPTTTTDDHGVKFTNADGTATVKVKARGDKLQVKATTKLADLVGSGTWAANVFGAGTGAKVAYTIGVDADGEPTIKIDSATAPSGVGVVVQDPANGQDRHGDTHGLSGARAAVVFSSQGFSKTLTLSVSARKDGTATFKVTLSGRDRQKVTGTLADLAGDRVWTAHLCDGTPVAVSYHVESNGTIMVDATTGPPATVNASEHGTQVRFDGTSVGVSIRLKALEGGQWSLKVSGKSGDCGTDHKTGRDGASNGGQQGQTDRTGGDGKSGGSHARGNGGHGGGNGH